MLSHGRGSQTLGSYSQNYGCPFPLYQVLHSTEYCGGQALGASFGSYAFPSKSKYPTVAVAVPKNQILVFKAELPVIWAGVQAENSLHVTAGP